MNYYIWQSLLLLAVAYFLGALIGCWLRKMFKARPGAIMERTGLAPELATAGAAAATVGGTAKVRTLAPTSEREASVEIDRADLRMPKPDVKVAAEGLLDIELPKVKLPDLHLPELGAVATAAVGAVAAAKGLTAEGLPDISLPKVGLPDIDLKVPELKVPEVSLPKVGLPDIDLKVPDLKVPDIGLPEIGAAAGAAGVAVAAKELVTGHLREVEPDVSLPKVELPEVSAPAVETKGVATHVEQETGAVHTSHAVADDLSRIVGIGGPTEAALNRIGITRFEQIANWTNTDIASISQKLGFAGRIERENWMDQARILASGKELAFTTHRVDADAAAPATVSGHTTGGGHLTQAVATGGAAASHKGASVPDLTAALAAAVGLSGTAAAAKSAPATPVVLATDTAKVAATSAVSAATAADATATAAVGGGFDDLKRIHGIGTNIEKALNARGVTRYSHIAEWSPADTTKFAEKIGVPVGRIEREKWIHQARMLAANVK